ncbi:hypothetical protein DOTSEDRAFT_72935 [Dothistroma septosporum NZE10]|uniref:peptidylprolyl isomerase n=1 Tax=Dothistroma septosporum (strain NZE10 / CBS 128990) TaxID=675120 RepID=N1PKA6_DOTSN|nr:hypothetical protein DOTSEDRAFT_72935 [Dothistroma septosporum NZE10]
MSGLMPMALYGLEVPAGDVAITAKPEIPSAFRITMAAIDPSAEPEGEEGDVPRATLKIIRQALIDYEDEDDYDAEDFDVEEMERMLAEEEDDDDEDDSDDGTNGGPSDPTKTKAARKAAAQKQIAALLAAQEEDMDVDEAPNGVNGSKKSAKALGKMPASDDSEDDDEDSDDDEGEEYEEFVLCTLGPTKNYQQSLDITVGEHERVLFKVSGTHSIFLTGNYVEPAHQHGPEDYDSEEDYDEEDYDLEPDSDELDAEEDELDDIEDPRITELEEEDEQEAPALVPSKADKKAEKKGKNKRPAEDELTNGASLDDLMSAAKKEVNGEEKLTKKQKKQKKNDGTAAAVEEPLSTKSDKKVQFAKELEQGPTPTKDVKKDEKPKTAGVKKVGGVTIDDKKVGTGPVAKSGDRVGLRYIGKLVKDNKIFDSNKSGKPFTFKLGAGEVIKGWEIGIQGMSAGGERRITIPAKLAYGNKGAPPAIPGNADLIFDVKLLSIGGR